MLVLSRKACQAVVVGGPADGEPLLTVTVLQIRGGRVRLGFEIDAVPVHRQEVWDRLRGGANPQGPAEGPTEPVP